MNYVKSFRDLEIYKLAKELAIEIFEMTKYFPKEEKYSLTDQIRRSSRSVGAQIAEAWGKRDYIKQINRCRWRTVRNSTLGLHIFLL